MLKDNILINNKIFYLVLFSLILHLVAPYFSVGYFKMDEHFSILEPINYKLNKDSTLGWDFFQYYDRSWFIPYIYFLITKFLSLFSIDNPFYWAFAYRLFSSLLGWFSIICLIYISQKIFKNTYSFYVALISLTIFWFYPFLHSRTSSENIGSSLLIIGITIFLIPKKNSLKFLLFYISGLILGFSFLARFTLGFSIFGFGIWTLLINRNKFFELFFTALGIISSVFIGVLIDYWGYSSFQFTPLNYYLFNGIILMNYFQSYPWWYFFYLIVTEFVPPLSIIVLLSMIIFWIRLPLNFITWTTLPSFIFLSSIPYKEIRFLFPILVFSPLFIACLFDFIDKKAKYLIKLIFFKRLITFFIYFIIILNVVVLMLLSITPANNAVNLYKFLYQNPYQIKTIHTLNGIPYKKGDLLNNFYRNEKLNFIRVMNSNDCSEKFFKSNLVKVFDLKNKIKNNKVINFPEVQRFSIPNWVFNYKLLCNKEKFFESAKFRNDDNYILFSDFKYFDLFSNKKISNCSLIYSTIPMWFFKFNYNNWIKRSSNWYIFKCTKL